MRVSDLFSLESLSGARIVAGSAGASRTVRWAHVVDMPEPAPWVEDGQVLLTTGFSWPGAVEAEREQLVALNERRLAAVGLAVPGFVARFSDSAKETADRLGLPLIEIPWDVPFARITAELHRELISTQQNLIARSEDIHRALTRAAVSGITLGELAERLGELIGRSVTIEDAHFKLLASCTIEPHSDAARRETLERTETPADILRELDRRGDLERLRASESPVRVAPLPGFDFGARVACPIRAGGELAGFVWIIEGREPFSELDNRAAEHAALVAALQISHHRELALLEDRLGYASFLSLLEAPSTTALALERARLLGFDPELPYRAGIVQMDEPLPLGREGVLRRDAIVERLRRHLSSHAANSANGAAPMLGASADRIPFLLPATLDLENVDRALRNDAVRIGFGRVATGTDGVRRSYREARDVLGYGAPGRIIRYEDALLPRVLLGDATARDAFLTELFSGLEKRKNGASLREALLRFAEEAFAFRRTAEALDVHPNTLRYRLERASACTGLVLDDPDVRFRLQLAVRLLHLSDVRHKGAPQS